MQSSSNPLVVDLDGTLLKVDTFHEMILKGLIYRPWRTISVLFFRGLTTSQKKAQISESGAVTVSNIILNDNLYNYLLQQKKQGRQIFLGTGASEAQAKSVLDSMPGLFDGAFSSSTNKNLTGEAKARELSIFFGEQKFVYAGNSKKDLAVFRSASAAIPVNLSQKNRRKLSNKSIEAEFPKSGKNVRNYWRLLRPHQWVKNLLLLVPLLTGRQLENLGPTLLAVLAFCLAASGSYIVNDLIDINNDRLNLDKKHRPIANGDIQVLQSLFLFVIMLTFAFIAAALVSIPFLLCLVVYFLASLTYSRWLKSLPLIDAFVLSALYCLRIAAGGLAGQVPLSFWLVTFAFLVFLSLALLKRYAEIFQADSNELPGRGYLKTDGQLVLGLGLSTATASFVLYTIYLGLHLPTNVDLTHGKTLSALVFLLWLFGLWQDATRGTMHSDPVLYSMKNKKSIFLLGIFLAFWIIPLFLGES